MLTRLDTRPQAGSCRVAELLAEIALLEARIRAMGQDGDCAYERAMSRLYSAMVGERRRRLEQMQAGIG
ncbi:MAG: hypothetical protein PVI91_10390 [Gammaproteobacteria bacterium]|jgi:hypothetical protein